VTRRPIKIGIAGTHSTGKSSFLDLLLPVLRQHGLSSTTISGFAEQARALGFPILAEHTFYSTLWIMAEGLRQEAEASLHNDVILVDRPVPDALGYLLAALEVSRRDEDPRRIDELRAIARAHARDYDILIVTSLDTTVPLGDGRDQNAQLREASARHLEVLISEFAPEAWRLTSSNADALVARVSSFLSSRLIQEKPKP
jgi:hypothetical protein